MVDAACYGKALFQLAHENGTDTLVLRQTEAVRVLLKDNPAYITLLDTPSVPTPQKLALLREAFGMFDAMLVNTLSLLCEKRVVYLFPACASAYNSSYDETHHIVRAIALTAAAMQPKQCAALQDKLEHMTGKTVDLTNQVEPALLGGIILRYSGVQLDDSVRGKLDRFRRSLKEIIV